MSEGFRTKLSERTKGNRYHLGFKHSEETKIRLSVLNKGKKISEERRLRMIGRKASKDARKNMSISRMGRQFSEETKRKISNSVKNYWNSKKELENSLILTS